MKKILTASDMKKYDAYTINEIGIPSMVLMERAALSVCEEVWTFLHDTNKKPADVKVLVVCGMGNNGGDGFAVARLLSEAGCRVRVLFHGDRNKLTAESKTQYEILQRLGLNICTQMKEEEYDIIIDALFGIGLSRPLEDSFATLVTALNEKKAYKIAVDIPSGLCADTGKVLGVCFKADVTVTFGFHKRGLLVGDGMLYAGRIICKDIGIIDAKQEEISNQVWFFDEDVSVLLPPRKANGNKGTFGKVLIYAGNHETFGAALLCAKSAFAAGAGMVKVLCPYSFRSFMLHELPEAMLTCYEQDDIDLLETKIADDLTWCDTVIAGPGIGLSKQAKEILQIMVKYAKVPMVLDADALNLLSEDEDLRHLLVSKNEELGRTVVLTPHMGELGRLLKQTVKELKEAPFDMARKLSEIFHSIAVCKDARTVICYKNREMYLNTSGNHGMATAGSGDVLAGLLGAYLALGGEPYHKTAAIAVYLHGKAGDEAASKVGERALTASQIIEGMISLQKGN